MGKRGRTYNKQVFVELVEKFLPVSTDDWEKLIPLYKAAANEEVERTAADLSRHFQSLMKGKKPTGQSQPDSLTMQLNKIRKKMEKKTFSGSYGEASDEDSNSSDEEIVVATPAPPTSLVGGDENLLPSPLNLENEVEGNSSSTPPISEVGKKRKNENSDSKSKNSRNSSRVAIGSILKDLVDQMKSPGPVVSPYSSSDLLHQEVLELRRINQKLIEANNNLVIQLSTIMMKDHQADNN